MTLCTTSMPGGINFDCLTYPAPVENLIITDASKTFTKAELEVLSKWKEAIQEDLEIVCPSAVVAYENTTDDPQINTLQNMGKLLVKKGVPSGVFYFESNFCDWNEAMRTLKGGTYRVFFVLADGAIMGHKNRDNTEYKGFKCEIHAITKGIPMSDTIENAFPVFVNFKSYAEFQQRFAFVPGWSPQLELPAAMPMSYNMGLQSSAQATATVVVDITERCGDIRTADLQTADIEVISSTLTDDTVSGVTNNDDGTFDVAFTTAAVGQIVKFRVKELTGTVVDSLTNPLTVEFTS